MAIRDLRQLLKTLDVVQHDGIWAFETHEDTVEAGNALMTFREREGVTCIRPAGDRKEADNRWVWLELSVYSDLHAVGFVAAIAKALEQAGVPCNVIAAYHHDHVFVPEESVDNAIKALKALSEAS